ncbi:hypothetical protein ZWY2020_052597, partial [Hordeum vulgare]
QQVTKVATSNKSRKLPNPFCTKGQAWTKSYRRRNAPEDTREISVHRPRGRSWTPTPIRFVVVMIYSCTAPPEMTLLCKQFILQRRSSKIIEILHSTSKFLFLHHINSTYHTTSDQVLLRISVAYVLVPFDLFRVLHIILKLLKLNDSELKDEFICLSIYHIQKLHWDPGYQFNVGKVVSLVTDDRHSLSKDSAQFGIVSGSLLQLLCSLVEQSDMEDMDRRDVFVKLADVIPRLATYLQEQWHIPKSLSQYSKNKILMLMIRLKPHIQQTCSHIVCLLTLLRHHFQGLLHEPMFQHSTKLENCLEGSPFLLSGVVLGELQDKSTRHLQRQAMYLFLSCSIFLACCGNDSRLNCSCKSDHKGQGCTDNCNYFGLSEISVWFQRCCLDEILDSKSSTDIVLCFLQLYMEEDDMLFIILLHLLDAPLISLAIDKMETKWTSELIGAKLFSTIFDPVYIFHQWLSLLSQSICYTSYSLHYDDHLALVDYLIAKDVGVHCAQYLLRCWDAFVDDSVYEAQYKNSTIQLLHLPAKKTVLHLLLRLLPHCSHAFHPECIDPWLEARIKCPLCRANLEKPPPPPPPAVVPPSPEQVARRQPSPSSPPHAVAIPVREEEESDEDDRKEEAMELEMLRSERRAARLPRSHSMGHSLFAASAAPAERSDHERFTLRLPHHVREQVLRSRRLRHHLIDLGASPESVARPT